MSQQELTIQVIDRRMQTDKVEGDSEQSIGNQFMDNVGFNTHPQHTIQEQEDEEEDEVVYEIDKLLPKQNQKEKLIEQNIKLKTQIYQLAKQLDEILSKEKVKKKKYGITIPEQEDEQVVRQKKLELKQSQIQTMELKNKIFVAKRQLQSIYNNTSIRVKEDELVNLRRKVKILESEKQGLVNIKRQQSKALKLIKNEADFNEKINAVAIIHQETRQSNKQMLLKINQSEKQLKKIHGNYISKQQKLKEIQQKLLLNKEKIKNKKHFKQSNQTHRLTESMNKQGQQFERSEQKGQPETITEEMIIQLEEEVKRLQQQKKQDEKIWHEKINLIEDQTHLRKIQEEKKLLILREKQKQLRLNELKIRELRKIVRQNLAAESQQNSKDIDMSQYRHKRNIRYMDK